MAITLFVERGSGFHGYALGEQPKVTAVFRSVQSGGLALVDPSTVVALVRTPAGVETEFTFGEDDELVRDSSGTYSISVILNEPSIPAAPGATPPRPFATDWFVAFRASGSYVGAIERRLHVRPSNFTTPLPDGGGVSPFAMFDDGEAMTDDGESMTDTP
jgi:hypothetical protein